MFCKPDLPHTIEVDSDIFFRQWSAAETTMDIFGRKVELGGSFSFCYIDGNHSYEFAKRDFRKHRSLISPRGLHDSGDVSGWEVCKVSKKSSNPATTI